MNLIDTHAHIYNEDYSYQIDEVIKTAVANGVDKIISIGVDLKSSEQCIKLSEKYKEVFATCGIHPHESDKVPNRYTYELEEMCKEKKVVGIGEIGLDYYYEFSDKKVQRKIFYDQLELATDIDLPAVVHCRNSDDDVLRGIKELSKGVGVIHCFASTYEFAEKILETGFHLSFTGLITFVKELEEVVKKIPLEKMMVETDSPYLTPKPHRGKKNEPSNVRYVAEKIADLKGVSFNKVAESTTLTALNLFKKLSNNP